jgi:hypothetical protein
MKDNLQLKASYFAQYWGQRIFHYDNWGTSCFEYISHEYIWLVKDSPCWIKLRSISSLTDEEAIQVAKIVEPLEKDYHTAYFGKMWANDILKFTSIPKALPVTEYLKSLSVALPCFDPSINQLIPIETLIERGWIKII